VPPGRRNFERALGVRLAFDFGEVDIVLRPLRQQRGEIDPRLGQLRPAVQEVGQLGEIAGPQHTDPGDHARLRKVLARQDECLEPRQSRRQSDRERPAHRSDRAFQAKLAQHRDPS